MTASPLLFDRTLHRQRLDRAAPDYASADFLKARAAQDVVMRLETILRRFPVAVDLGSRNGSFSKALADSDAAANIDVLFETDLSAKMLAGRPGLRVAADEERLPFGDDTLDLVVSTLALHWTNDLVGALIQVRRALRPDGLFIGAMFGGATLTELRQCLLAAEAEVSDGAAMRVSPFADASDAAALLQRAGFALPVADVDRVKVRYAHPIKLLQDLRAMGETSVLLDRSKKPLPRKVLLRALELYVERFAEADGRVPATFEIVAVTGWAPHDSQQKPLRPGSAKMRLADALGTTEQSTGEKPG
ncbi:methyltransferase domain-containing protein [Caulobacter sp. RHG1]|uniref:methyltransferase domain-containing protein n=1 Tax=Caulobacter sp. (strain RHG1) TaxID=2545762 RepID=UPI0015516559|nr:methyltransferase domain-containing protein [Caulobacter sp. RHG1]NQE64645.1 SAM-dependent methyltransferase, BioC-like [Caulobacter sp. RHG1]